MDNHELPQEPTQEPELKVSRKKKYIWLAVLLIIVIAAGVFAYWYSKNYRQPTPKPLNVQTEEVPPMPVTGFSPENNFYFTGGSSDASLFKYDASVKTSKQIFSVANYNTVTFFGATNDTAYAHIYTESAPKNKLTIVAYQLNNKQSKTIIEPTSSNYHFARYFLSPDKKQIVYTEICYKDCGSFNNIIKTYDIAAGTTKTVYEQKKNQNSSVFVSANAWVEEGKLLLGDYCECDGVAPLREARLLDIQTGNITAIKIEASLDVHSVVFSPDGTKIAYTAEKVEDPEVDGGNMKFVSYLKVKTIADNSLKVLKTASNEYFSDVEWLDNESLIYVSDKTTELVPGMGAYPEFKKGQISKISVANPEKVTVLDTNTNVMSIQLVQPGLFVYTKTKIANPNSTDNPQYEDYVYDIKNSKSELLKKDNKIYYVFFK